VSLTIGQCVDDGALCSVAGIALSRQLAEYLPHGLQISQLAVNQLQFVNSKCSCASAGARFIQ
jgi:hypothetical protein